MTAPERWSLLAYSTRNPASLVPEPAARHREWMRETPAHFAQRCLPLTIANQAGWVVRVPFDVNARWNGQQPLGNIELSVSDPNHPAANCVSDHFGSGVLTFAIPYLFRTPPGIGLLVRGAPNFWIDGAHPLEGLVETDWASSTFTMNWKLLTPHRLVRFRAGDPVCFLQPFELACVEGAEPSVRSFEDDDPALGEAYGAWSQARDAFNSDRDRRPSSWQRHYFVGQHVAGGEADEHRKRVRVASFAGAFEVQAPGNSRPAEAAPARSERLDGLRAHWHHVEEFLSDAYELRAAAERHFAPGGVLGTEDGVWDLFNVPGQYAYLRTFADRVIQPALLGRLERAVRDWGWRHLGMGRITKPQLSLYLDGCGQGLHNDAGDVYHAFIYSLSPPHGFAGGETLLLRDEPYWGTARTSRAGAGETFMDRVAPAFNRLLVFDSRIIHGVETVRGDWDPDHGRLVVQGQFLPGGLRVTGELDRAAVVDALRELAQRLDEHVPELRSAVRARIGIRVDVDADASSRIEVLSAWVAPLNDDAGVAADIVARVVTEVEATRLPAGPGTATFTVPIDDLAHEIAPLAMAEEYDPVPTDGGFAVRDPAGQERVLNASAAFILLSCTGDADGGEIAEAVRESFGLDEPPLELVEQCLVMLRSCGLVAPVTRDLSEPAVELDL